MSALHLEKLRRVTRRDPCPICEHHDWCSFSADGALVICMRVSSGSVSEARDGGFVHILREREARAAIVRAVPKPNLTLRASIEQRHTVYSAWLERSPLTGYHADHLLNHRSLSDVTIARDEYVSLPTTLSDVLSISRELASQYDLTGVPGFFKDGDGRWRFLVRQPGFVIPVRDALGRIQACLIRQDTGARYLWLSSPDRTGGASSGAPVHFARPWRARSTSFAVITEGALKADIIAEHLDQAVIALAGVSSHSDFGQLLRRELPELKAVAIAFDSDWRSNGAVRAALLRLIDVLEEASLAVKVWNWEGAKGLDDLLTESSEVRV